MKDKLLAAIDRFVASDWFAYCIMKSRVWRVMPWRIRTWRWRVWEGCYYRQMKREGEPWL